MPPIQQAVGTGSGTSFTVTLGAAPQAGSTLVFLVMDEVLTGVTVTGGGATWEQGRTTGTNYGITYWIGKNCSGAAGLTTITYNMTSSAIVRLGNVSEWAGLDTSPMDWKPAGTSGTSTAPLAPATTPSRAGGVAFALMDWKTAVTVGAAAGGFTNLTQATGAGNLQMQGAYREFTSIAAYQAGWTLSGSTAWDGLAFDLLIPVYAPLKTALRDMPGKPGLRTLPRGFTPTTSTTIPAVTGTGGLAFGFSESGTAVETITGTGAWAKGFTEQGTALETFTSTGGVAFRFAESATATEKMTATGGVAFTFSESGTASELIATGTGSLAFGFTESGTAVEKMTATGSLAFGFTEQGTARETFTGTGALAFGFTESGTAQTGDLASGGVAFTFAESGTGVESIPASGGLAFGFSLAGTALQVQPVDGSGGVAFGFSMDGIAGNTSVVSGGRARAGFITFPEWAKKQRVTSPRNPLLRVEVTPSPTMSQPRMMAEGGAAFGFSEGGDATVNDDELVLLAL